METKLLETLVAVVEAGSFSSAASMLGVTQSMVSRRVGELEAHCGVRLLYRHGRGVKLTPAGEALYQGSQPLMAQMAALMNTVADAGSSPAGAVSIAVSPSLLSAVGLDIIETLAREHPDIRLQSVAGYSRYVHEWLLQGRIDIGVLSDAGLSNQLLAEDLGAARVVLSGRPDLVPAGEPDGTLPFHRLGAVPLILPSQGQGLRRYIEAAATRAAVHLEVVHEVDDIQLTKDLMSAGHGLSLLSELATFKETRDGIFVSREVTEPRLFAPSMVATALNQPVTPAMKAVIAVIKQVCAPVLKRMRSPVNER